MPRSTDETRALLNAQTGKLGWPELARHFARGVVIKVTPDMDLVGVATAIVEDRKHEVEAWQQTGKLAPANDEDARRWQVHDCTFWTVVAAPWVLVQEIRSDVQV
ncbi:MAG: DUF2288 domain-containing protein [Pseudomonadota bacterium]|nr:MAG: DUF2288 domain-containing protein [Pseudomonadota bacterium]